MTYLDYLLPVLYVIGVILLPLAVGVAYVTIGAYLGHLFEEYSNWWLLPAILWWTVGGVATVTFLVWWTQAFEL